MPIGTDPPPERLADRQHAVLLLRLRGWPREVNELNIERWQHRLEDA
jgi:hypothetical protein